MKVWIDDLRPAPEGYVWCKSVNAAKAGIADCEEHLDYAYALLALGDTEEAQRLIEDYTITLLDIDHDAGAYAADGGDYIKLLDWLEETHRSYPIHIHSMNSVGVLNMRAIIQHNNWTEVVNGPYCLS